MEQRIEARYSELLHWPDSMWPINSSFLDNLPLELLPDMAALSRVRYPWELSLTHKSFSNSHNVASLSDISYT